MRLGNFAPRTAPDQTALGESWSSTRTSAEYCALTVTNAVGWMLDGARPGRSRCTPPVTPNAYEVSGR